MKSICGRYWLTFNGEIYNFVELRLQLEKLGHQFCTDSDTEVMLASFSQWGLEVAVRKFTGMFAFALWDQQEQQLSLGRDRLGEKPLYYGCVGKIFLFGSELKALRAHPQWQGEIDRNVLALYMRHAYIPAPYSIYQGIYKLPPGTTLTLTDINSVPAPTPYWSFKSVAEAGINCPLVTFEAEAIQQLDTLLRDVIHHQMVADVPVGAFLSGGIDSSTVVALMQAQCNRPIKTFTIGFEEQDYNEAAYAQAVAKHLRTDHTELYVKSEDAIAVIPKLATLYDEPFADASGIPVFLLSSLARQQVTVCLSGDGGDELFAGYNRHFMGRTIWQSIRWVPQSLRKLAAECITVFPKSKLDQVLAPFSPCFPPLIRQNLSGERLHQVAEILGVANPEAMYRNLVSDWKESEAIVLNSRELPTVLVDPSQWAELLDLTERMMFLDTLTYLPDNILAKVDRASMGASLEVRVPFLDHQLVEFAWRIPMRMKINHHQSKWILRQVLYRYIPASLINRPKMGFGVPIDSWLRGSLREWAENLLNEKRLQQEGFFNPQPIRQKWTEHLDGNRNWQYHLWSVLMFQAWLETEASLK
jgi:asparagine synthase (glutamine-hydrolysing)